MTLRFTEHPELLITAIQLNVQPPEIILNSLIALWQDMTTMELIVGLLIITVAALFGWLIRMSSKYNQMDKLLLLVCDRSHRDLVKIHRNGDYEIAQPLNKE